MDALRRKSLIAVRENEELTRQTVKSKGVLRDR